MKLLTSILIVCATSLIVAAIPATAQGKPANVGATVRIHVVDEYGLTVKCRVEHSVDHHFKRGEMVPRFHGLQGTQIPYGIYAFELIRPGPGVSEDLIKGAVTVSSPEVPVTVPVRRVFTPGASADIAIPAGFVIRGRLQPAPKSPVEGEALWIRLSPVYEKNHLDVSVDPSGEFRIYEPLVGRYILSVIRGEEVLQIQQVEFEEGLRFEDFVVRLSDHPPAVLRVGQKRDPAR